MPVLLLGLVGCGQVNGGSGAHTALLRIVDASPDTGNVDVYLNSTAAAYNLSFGSTSSYFPVTPATYTVGVNAAGTRTLLTSVRSPLAINTQYTLLVGNVAAGLQSTLLTDQGQSASYGQVSVRFLNQAVRTGAVDIYLVPATGALATTAAVVQGVGFNQVRSYQNVPAGNYSIVVLAAGSAAAMNPVPLYSGNQVNLPGSSARTLVLLDGQLSAAPSVQPVLLSDYDSPNFVQ